MLIIKHANAHLYPEERSSLIETAKDHTNIRLMDEILDPPDLAALIRCADCLISLHRAEGFGFLLAEAMALGIPVIGTDYGGSTDFLNPETGFPIPWSPAIIEPTIGPYEQGMEWAEPDLDTAAEAMRNIVEQPDVAHDRAERGKVLITEKFNAQIIGGRISERLRNRNYSLIAYR